MSREPKTTAVALTVPTVPTTHPFFEVLAHCGEYHVAARDPHGFLQALCCENIETLIHERQKDPQQSVHVECLRRIHDASVKWRTSRLEARKGPLENQYAAIALLGSENPIRRYKAGSNSVARMLAGEDRNDDEETRANAMRLVGERLSGAISNAIEAELDSLFHSVKCVELHIGDHEKHSASMEPANNVAPRYPILNPILKIDIPSKSLDPPFIKALRERIEYDDKRGEKNDDKRRDEMDKALLESVRRQFEEVDAKRNKWISDLCSNIESKLGHPQSLFGSDDRAKASLRHFLWLMPHFYRALGLNYVYLFPNYISVDKESCPGVFVLGFEDELDQVDRHAFARMANVLLHLPHVSRRVSPRVLNDVVTAISATAENVLSRKSVVEVEGRNVNAHQMLDEASDHERQSFWRAYFQALLRHPLASIAPGSDKTQCRYCKMFSDMQKKYLDNYKVHKEALDDFGLWCDRSGNKPFWLVANFWNASDERVSSLVANHLQPRLVNEADPARWRWDAVDDNEPRYEEEAVENRWTKSWDLFIRVNDIPTRSPECQLSGPEPNSIGSFIIGRSRHLDRAPLTFENRVGPGEWFCEFQNFLNWWQEKEPQGDWRKFDGRSIPDSNEHLIQAMLRWMREEKGVFDEDEACRRLDEFFAYMEFPAAVVRRIMFESYSISKTIDELLPPECRAKGLDKICLFRLLEDCNLHNTDSAGRIVELIADGVDPRPNELSGMLSDPSCDEIQAYLKYVRCCLAWRYFNLHHEVDGSRKLRKDVEGYLTEKGIRTLIVNNLTLMSDSISRQTEDSFTCVLADEPPPDMNWDASWHCEYCVPTWSTQVSYLYVAMNNPLDEWQLNCFQKLTDRLMSIAWAHDSARKQEEDQKAIIENGKKAARAAIMGRNLSHNIGSHVIASIKEEDCKKHTAKIQKFHSFLQVRMDFIARITTEWPEWGQPMYFIRDILAPLVTEQSIFLRYLLADQWSEDKPIRFVVHIDGHEVTLECDKSVADQEIPNDKLVTIPEGNVGAHAVYILLENLLRNSVKYGDKREKTFFEVHLKLEEMGNTCELLRLSIWDNFSHNKWIRKDADGQDVYLASDMAERYRQPLIDPKTGVLLAGDWGIQELLTCAKFLIHPSQLPANTPTPEQSLPLTPLAVNIDGSAATPDNTDAVLCNQLYLKTAKLIGWVSPTKLDAKEERTANRVGVAFRWRLADLADDDGGFQIAVIDMTDDRKWPEQLQLLTEYHRRLPYRLLLLASADQKDSLETKLRDQSGLPVRRVVVTTDRELSLPGEDADPAKWESLVLQAHGQWLCHHENFEDKQHLVIQIAKGRDSIYDRWKKLLDPDTGKLDMYVKNLVDIFLLNEFEVAASSVSIEYSDLVELFQNERSRFIIFDNHRLLLGNENWRGSTDQFRQSIGTSQLRTFNALSNPPGGCFAFNYFVLKILEAAITRVVIIDERVSEASVDKSSGDSLLLHDELNAARCYPFYALRKVGADGEHVMPIANAFEPPTTGTKRMGQGDFDKVDRENLPIPRPEGLSITDISSSKLWVRTMWGSMELDEPVQPTDSEQVATLADIHADFVIIHQGVIDTFFKGNEKSVKSWIEQFYGFAPMVVITSGRGRSRMKHVKADTPFLEFSLLKNATYPELSKYELAAVLGSLKGRKE